MAVKFKKGNLWMNTLFKKKKLPMAVFVAPTIILFGLIIVIPLIQSAVMGFTEWDGINKATFTKNC